jgi:hypothetical protein
LADILCALPWNPTGSPRGRPARRPACVRAVRLVAPGTAFGVALESLWSRSDGRQASGGRTRVALESLGRDQFRAPRCGLLGHELASGGESQPRPHPDAEGCSAPGNRRCSLPESPEGPAGAQRARSERTAGGSSDRFRPSRCGLLLHELWPRSRAKRSAYCAYGWTVNPKGRRADKSRFRVGSRRPISATSMGIVTA